MSEKDMKMLSSVHQRSLHLLERPSPRVLPDSDHPFIHPALKPTFDNIDHGGRRPARSEPAPPPPGPGTLPIRPLFHGLPMSALPPSSMNLLSAAGGLAISASTSSPPGMISPFFPYPGLLSAADEFKYLSMAQLQATNQAHFAGELAKLKQPMLTRNYLELAMLVCNTFRGKLFPCPHCRYVTDRRNNLKRHVATMHQACDKQLECCGVPFTTKASLREHITIFHHNGYSCPFCGRRFCRKALLKRHLSVHSGQKDFTCPHCDYATSHKSNLERHKRIHARLQIMGESGLGGMPRDVGAMFTANGLNQRASPLIDLAGLAHGNVTPHAKHSWAKSLDHVDDPEDCDVDIDDDSDNDQSDDQCVNVDGENNNNNNTDRAPAIRFDVVVAEKSEQPINLVTERNIRASAASQLVSRLTHGFAVPFMERDFKK
ncbi:hypothetical protein Btru_031665 [Bulinus truncatus]|nr:hypothetical protein Btru_031665 [Bulinus truncatus]